MTLTRALTFVAVFLAGEILGYFVFPGFSLNVNLCLLEPQYTLWTLGRLVIFNVGLIVIVALFVYLKEKK